ncbi:MAG TPA: Asp-tRNA(Asn)/Glu-tRNA(Gln) amidotransferase subunit GatC [Anaerolineae bacterium]|nr:Asp-tRNA(Asn)/Glu-tRNA(Gln) amidotransferase subunit GatC [Anaerolineae bacterium]
MSLTRADVEKVALLARLALTEGEISQYQEQLTAVLAYVERINELDVDDIEPTTHAVPMANVWREDVIEPSLTTEEALANAPQKAEAQFKIKAVLPAQE